MTSRQANWLLIGWFCLFLLTIAIALYLTTINRTKPSPFVPPAIWSVPHETPLDRQFAI